MLRENNINFLKGLLKRFDDGVSVIDETEKETIYEQMYQYNIPHTFYTYPKLLYMWIHLVRS